MEVDEEDEEDDENEEEEEEEEEQEDQEQEDQEQEDQEQEVEGEEKEKMEEDKEENKDKDEDNKDSNVEINDDNNNKKEEEEEEKEKDEELSNDKKKSKNKTKTTGKKSHKSKKNKKMDIAVLDLEQLKKEREENNDLEKMDSSSTDSDFKVEEYNGKNEHFFFPWKCIYATEGPWKVRLLSRPLEMDIIYKIYADLKLMQANGKEYMCNNIMAQVLDLAHPSHQLQNLLLMYPLSASSILKKRLLALGYKLVIPIIHEEINTFTVDTSIYIMSQIIRKVEREMKFYFEVNATENSIWRIGIFL